MANDVGDEAVQPTLDAVNALQARFRAVCAERGIREDDIARMQDLEEKRQGRLKSVDELQKRLVAVQKEADSFPLVLAELHTVWKAQFDCRSEPAAAIKDSVASTTVRLTHSSLADEGSFKAAWGGLALLG